MRPVVSSSGKRGPVLSSVATYSVTMKRALAAHEAVDVHQRRALGCCLVAGPLHRALLLEELVADTPAKLGVVAAISSMICDGWV